ncbi:hypothetical protein OG422_29050 [Streptomyces sp. NBC_01525]|uniref:hypothetical protein n=1 Tax=Streptomyces sp. NBC_01525 TaxID=2903893 RepID=UPI003866CF86
MSDVLRPAWWRPALRVYRWRVDKHLDPAQTAAAELGVGLDAAFVRQALAYRCRTLLRRVPAVVVAVLFTAFAWTVNGAGCTAGGVLDYRPAP